MNPPHALRLVAALAFAVLAFAPNGALAQSDSPIKPPATFTGRIPGADVLYIDVTLRLNADGTYLQRYVYAGKAKPFVDGGSWRYDASRSNVELIPQNGQYEFFHFKAPNTLVMLDRFGDPIVSKNNYSLTRASSAATSAGVPTAHELESTLWYLVYVADHKVITTSAAATPSITFDPKTNTATGTGGCNRFHGTYEATASGSLHIGPLAATRMACADTMAVENEFFKALDRVRGYHIEGNILHLVDAKGDSVANLTPGP